MKGPGPLAARGGGGSCQTCSVAPQSVVTAVLVLGTPRRDTWCLVSPCVRRGLPPATCAWAAWMGCGFLASCAPSPPPPHSPPAPCSGALGRTCLPGEPALLGAAAPVRVAGFSLCSRAPPALDEGSPEGPLRLHLGPGLGGGLCPDFPLWSEGGGSCRQAWLTLPGPRHARSAWLPERSQVPGHRLSGKNWTCDSEVGAKGEAALEEEASGRAALSRVN